MDHGVGSGKADVRRMGRPVEDGGERLSHPVPVPEAARVPAGHTGPVAHVKRALGVTLNLGDYRSLRSDWEVILPCKMNMASIDLTAKAADEWCETQINRDVAAWTGDTAVKYLPEGPDAPRGKKK